MYFSLEKILNQLLPVFEQAGSLRFGQKERATAWMWLIAQERKDLSDWKAKANNANLLKTHLQSPDAYQQLQKELEPNLAQFGRGVLTDASDYLIQLLAKSDDRIEVSRDAMELCDDYLQFL